jgi:hypothetical protein
VAAIDGAHETMLQGRGLAHFIDATSLDASVFHAIFAVKRGCIPRLLKSCRSACPPLQPLLRLRFTPGSAPRIESTPRFEPQDTFQRGVLLSRLPDFERRRSLLAILFQALTLNRARPIAIGISTEDRIDFRAMRVLS